MIAAVAILIPVLSSLVARADPLAAPDDLYAGRVLVTGQAADGRPAAFAAALREVLVRVAGDQRLADDPRVTAMGRTAGELVARYAYRDRMAGIPVHDEQGTRDRPYELTVRFDPSGIDAALAALDASPWPLPRPAVALLVDIDAGSGTYRLTADGERGRDHREAVAEAARRFGLTVILPLNGTDPPDPATQAEVAGRLVWSDAHLGWMAHWRLRGPDGTVSWHVSGVSFDAAFRSAVGGAAQVLSGHGRPK